MTEDPDAEFGGGGGDRGREGSEGVRHCWRRSGLGILKVQGMIVVYRV